MDNSPLLHQNHASSSGGWERLQQTCNNNIHRHAIFRGRGSGSEKGQNVDDLVDDYDGVDDPNLTQQKRRNRRTCRQLCGCDPAIVRRRNTHQIVGYSVDALISFGFLTNTKGTLCRTRFLWIQTLIIFAVMSLIFILGIETKVFHGMSTTALYHLIVFMNGLCTFLLSLFISLSLSRWWSLRYDCVGDLFKSIAETAMLASSYLSNTEEKIRVRDQLVRYGILSFSLLFEDGRGSVSNSCYLRLKQQGICTVQEEKILRHIAVKAEVPNIWAMQLITRSIENGILPSAIRYDLHSRCLRQRSAVINALTYVQTPLPLMYVHLITTLVKITIFFWACYTGIMCAQAFDENTIGTEPADLWTLIPLQIFVPTVFQSALELHRKLQNPFLANSMGFPEDTLIDALTRECHDIQTALSLELGGIEVRKEEPSINTEKKQPLETKKQLQRLNKPEKKHQIRKMTKQDPFIKLEVEKNADNVV